MKHTRRRREVILSLLASRSLATQDELVGALRAEGVEASQASVSRDVSALGLVKIGGRWALPVVRARARDPLADRVRENLLSVAAAGDHLLVLKTPPGEASGVALAIDRMELAGIVGTVAGDDTIFAAVAGRREGAAVARRLHEIMAVPAEQA